MALTEEQRQQLIQEAVDEFAEPWAEEVYQKLVKEEKVEKNSNKAE